MSTVPVAPAVETYLWEYHRQQSLRGPAHDTIPEVRAIADMAKGPDKAVYGEAVVLKRPLFQKILLYFFLLYAVNCAVLLAGGLMTMRHALLPPVMFLVSVVIVLLVIWREWNNRGASRWSIVVAGDGIKLGDIVLYWSAIEAVYFMKKRAGKRTNEYLVLLDKTGSVTAHTLSGFYVPERRFALAVAHYKTLHQLGVSHNASN